MFKYFSIILLSVLSVGIIASALRNDNTTSDASLSFDKVLIVVLENQPLRASMRNYMMKNIVSKGTLLVNYYGLRNPSQPNYIGLLAGDMLGVSGDGVYNLAESNLVDLLEAKNITWKSYQEQYPGNCFAGDTPDGLYKRKHNPFISFDNVRENPQRCSNIVKASALLEDLHAGTVPQFSFYTPNMNNNGHDTGLSYAASWLYKTFIPTYSEPFSKAGNSLLVITFDEGVPGDNQIYTLLIGPNIPAGHIDDTKTYNHYSLLRLIEENYGLGSLNRNDATAERITSTHFVEGTIHFPADRVTMVLSIGLPLLAVTIGAIVAYTIHRRKVRQQRKLELAELNKLLEGGGDSV